MFCTSCGAQNDESSSFCYSCGAKLGSGGDKSVNSGPVEVQSNEPGTSTSVASKRKKYTETISSVILVVLIVIVLLASYTNVLSGFGLGGYSKVTFTSDFQETYSGGGPFVIDSSGTVWSIHSGGYMIQRFGNSVPFAISGTFSSNAKVTAFIIGESDWNLINATDHGNVPVSDMTTYITTSGNVATGSFQANLGAGNYYIVIFG